MRHASSLLPGDGFNPGHVVVVPRKNVASIYELEIGEQKAVWSLVAQVRAQ